MFKEERIGGLQSGNKDKKAKRDENIGRHGLRVTVFKPLTKQKPKESLRVGENGSLYGSVLSPPNAATLEYSYSLWLPPT